MRPGNHYLREVVATVVLGVIGAALFLPGRWYLLAWLPFAAGAWLVLRLPRRTALVLILLGAAVLPLIAARQPPTSSDDVYRYRWDGRVQSAGIDPYRYPPSAPQLRPFRDDVLWPRTAPWCVHDGCTLINRPDVPTIYPPVAEAVFTAVVVLSPARSGPRPMQVTAAAAAFLLTLLLWYRLSDPRRAVLWAWCPLVALETGNNAHIDVVAVLLAAVALGLLARRRPLLGGAVLGLAIATKVTPGLLLPAAVRRRPVAVVLGVLGAIATVYLPHVLAVGPAVLGYLPGYLHEEGFTNGNRYALLDWVLPHALAQPAAVVSLAAVSLWVLRKSDPDRPWLGASTMVAAALLVTTPNYPWYALLLVMLVALGAPAELLIIGVAAEIAQLETDLGLHGNAGPRLGYTLALAAAVIGLAVRARTRVTPNALPETNPRGHDLEGAS
jgi:Glycosyltransferase family 87